MLRAEHHHQTASVPASLLLGTARLLKRRLPPRKHSLLSAFLGRGDRGHGEAAGLSLQPTQLGAGSLPDRLAKTLVIPSLVCKSCLLGLIRKKPPQGVMQEETGPILLEMLFSPFSSDLSAHFESSAKGNPPAKRSQSPVSSLCPEGTWDICLPLLLTAPSSAWEQGLPKCIFCSSRCCDGEALHTVLSCFSPFPLAAAAGIS